MNSEQLYAALIYAYMLEPDPLFDGYTWRDHVVDSDHALTTGLAVCNGRDIIITISEGEAESLYLLIKPYIDKFGLDVFYENCFGYLYKRNR